MPFIPRIIKQHFQNHTFNPTASSFSPSPRTHVYAPPRPFVHAPPRPPMDAPPQQVDPPCGQPFFTFDHESKKWISSTSFESTSVIRNDGSLGLSHPALTVITWNIDFMKPLPDQRMKEALSYLHGNILSSVPPKNAVIILFQEMTQSDLDLIRHCHWVQRNFHITDPDPHNWRVDYGTCTLIDKRLHVKDVFRVRYSATQMGRDALFVDVAFPLSSYDNKTLRICNVHLESMTTPLRRPQLATAAHYMKDSRVYASILGGDCNAIEKYDRNLHAENNLRDAYLVLGGQEDKYEGYTWGFMSRIDNKFGCSRMDKVLFTKRGLWVKGLEKFGHNLELRDPKEREWLAHETKCHGGWVTDHLGLRADFNVL